MKIVLFILGAITAILLMFGAWRFGLMSNSLADTIADEVTTEVELLQSLPSPNSEYRVTANKVSNSRDWCEVRINVHKNNQPFDWEHDFICMTDCKTQTRMTWTSDNNLVIYYSNDDASAAVKTSQTFHSEDNAINISYVFQQ